MIERDQKSWDMIKLIKKICDDNHAIITTNDKFMAAYSDFNEHYEKVGPALRKQILDISGVGKDKKEVRDKALESAGFICAQCQNFCEENDDDKLLLETNLSHSKLRDMADLTFLGFCNHLIDLCETRLEGLSHFGVSSDYLSDFGDQVEEFDKNIGEPKRAKKESQIKGTAVLKKAIPQIKKILKLRMDKSVLNFRSAHRDFYDLYFKGRKTAKVSQEKPALSGIVKNEAGEPLKGLIIKLAGKRRKAKTTATGRFKFMRLKDGKYTVVVLDGKKELLRKEVVAPGNSYELLGTRATHGAIDFT